LEVSGWLCPETRNWIPGASRTNAILQRRP
jgi:hypothetical protein